MNRISPSPRDLQRSVADHWISNNNSKLSVNFVIWLTRSAGDEDFECGAAFGDVFRKGTDRFAEAVESAFRCLTAFLGGSEGKEGNEQGKESELHDTDDREEVMGDSELRFSISDVDVDLQIYIYSEPAT